MSFYLFGVDDGSSIQLPRVLREDLNLDPHQNGTSSDPALTAFQVTYYVIDVLLATLAIVGNLLIIIAYFCNKRLRIISHYHLMSLAVSDLLMGAVTIPIWLAAVFNGLPHSCYSCLLALSTVLFVDLASVYSLLAMTIDRYLFISQPLFYNTSITSRRTILWIICMWIIAVIFVLPLSVVWKWSYEQMDCNFIAVVDAQYLLFIFISSILLPIIAMGAMYLHIFIIVRNQKRKDREMYSVCIRLKKTSIDQERLTTKETEGLEDRARTNTTSYMSVSKSRMDHRSLENLFSKAKTHARISSEVQTALFFAFLLLFFIFTWVPMFVLDIFYYVGRPVSDTALNVAVLLSHCNSAFNPFLYRYRADFGKTIALRVCSKSARRPSQFSSTNDDF